MNGSVKIGSVLGIAIRVHVLLLVLLGFIFLADPDPVMAVLRNTILFGIVLLHELAHCVVAMRFGLRVVDITLWPLGGMARMSAIPESSRVEGLVAVAGPLSNFVLAALALPVWLWAAFSEPAQPIVRALSGTFLLFNLLLGTFNLLPAFPMDGGRILRAFLGRKGDWVRATQTAVRVGRVVAFLLAILGILTIRWLGAQSILFVLIALFVWWTGSQELRAVRARHGVDPLAAFREFAARATGWSQTQPVGEFARSPGGPAGGGAPPGRPAQTGRHDGAAPPGGFSDEEIERMERFRGPLGSYRREG